MFRLFSRFQCFLITKSGDDNADCQTYSNKYGKPLREGSWPTFWPTWSWKCTGNYKKKNNLIIKSILNSCRVIPIMTFIWIRINSNYVPFNESNWTLSVVKDDVKLAHAAAKFFEDDDGFSM